jgi:Asp-tRNA(Asn)/Glu-tRNA(Gln) amidotransferase A subunit family amidase
VTSRTSFRRSTPFVTCCNVPAVLYVVLGRRAAAASLAARLLRDGHDALVSAAQPPGPGPGPARALPLRHAIETGEADADLGGPPVTPDIPGTLWAARACAAMLAATAVSGRPAAEALEDPRCQPVLAELARQVLAEAPVPAMPLDGFDPADLAGSPGQLARYCRRSGITEPGIHRDLAARRPTEVPAILSGLRGTLVRRLAELVQAIEQGRRLCSRPNLDLLAAYERLERLGRPLNAVASVIGAPDRAAGGGPLAGRPVAVKDIIAVAGVPTRCGSPASDPGPASRDAALVRRLRAAGAEVFATTQCLEYAAGFAHPDVGDTRNPRDPSRTSGGSSGGSAALVAAGVCDLAIGTDTGGSVRIPAAYCGVVGFKPSYGLIPLDGVFPLSPACDHAGTLTATVRGAASLLAALAGPAPGVPGPAEATWAVGVLARQLADASVTAEVHDAVGTALDRLGAAGWELREITAPWLDRLAEWEQTLAVIVAREAADVHAGRDRRRYAEGTRALLEFGASVSDARYTRAQQQRTELAAAIEASLVGVDVLAGPAVGYPAPEQDPPFGTGEDHGESRFTGPYNLSGHPALSLPVPAPGLPAGLQLAGRRGGDWALLRIATAAESLLWPRAQASCPATPTGTQPGEGRTDA